MPRVKKQSYAYRKTSAKLRKRRERALAHQKAIEMLEREMHTKEYMEQKINELEELKIEASLYLSSFTPQWKTDCEDANGDPCSKKEDICNARVHGSRTSHLVGPTSSMKNQTPLQSREEIGNLKEKLNVDTISSVVEERDLPAAGSMAPGHYRIENTLKQELLFEEDLKRELDVIEDIKIEPDLDDSEEYVMDRNAEDKLSSEEVNYEAKKDSEINA